MVGTISYDYETDRSEWVEDAGLEWLDEEEFAWKYTSIAAFSDAKEYRGNVFLVFPNGRKMQVEKKEIFPNEP